MILILEDGQRMLLEYKIYSEASGRYGEDEAFDIFKDSIYGTDVFKDKKGRYHTDSENYEHIVRMLLEMSETSKQLKGNSGHYDLITCTPIETQT